MLPACHILNYTVLSCHKAAGFSTDREQSLRQRGKKKGSENLSLLEEAIKIGQLWPVFSARYDGHRVCASVRPRIIVATITGIPGSYLEWLGSNCQAVSFATMDAIVRLTARVSLDGGGAGVLLPHLSSAGRTVSSQQRQIMAITMKMGARGVINQNEFYLFGLNGFLSG